MSDEEWYGVPDDKVPITCPNCYDETGIDIPLKKARMIEPENLTVRIVLWGECPRCGESVAVCYHHVDATDVDDDEIFPTLTN